MSPPQSPPADDDEDDDVDDDVSEDEEEEETQDDDDVTDATQQQQLQGLSPNQIQIEEMMTSSTNSDDYRENNYCYCRQLTRVQVISFTAEDCKLFLVTPFSPNTNTIIKLHAFTNAG